MLDRLLAEYLVERRWVTPAQVDEARRTRGFFGGRFETHLLKLGYVSETVLGEALTEIAGVPFASWEHLRAAAPKALAAVPLPLIERHIVCPFRLDEGRLRVATLAPRERAAVQELEAATGLVVEPWIAIEPRLHQAIHRHYRLRFESMRGIVLPPGLGEGPLERPRGPERVVSPDTAEAELGLDGHPLDAELSLDEYLRTRSNPRGSADAGALHILEDTLEAASDRDELAEGLLTFCAARSSRSALFAVQKKAIRGLAGRGRAFAGETLRKLTVPVGSGTIFDTALQSRDFYFGVVPALPPNRDLYTALGGSLPENVMLLPIILKGRTIALLYLDGDDGPLPAPDIPLMRRVAGKAGLAVELILLRSKLRGL